VTNIYPARESYYSYHIRLLTPIYVTKLVKTQIEMKNYYMKTSPFLTVIQNQNKLSNFLYDKLILPFFSFQIKKIF